MGIKNSGNRKLKEEKVFISLSLEGKEKDLFLKVKRTMYIMNNAELARMILLPGLEAKLKKLDSKKTSDGLVPA